MVQEENNQIPGQDKESGRRAQGTRNTQGEHKVKEEAGGRWTQGTVAADGMTMTRP